MMTALTRHRLKSLLISLIGRNSKKAARRNHGLAIFSAITATLFFVKTERLLSISPTIEGITISSLRGKHQYHKAGVFYVNKRKFVCLSHTSL